MKSNPFLANYRGKHLEPYVDEEKRRKKAHRRNRILLFEGYSEVEEENIRTISSMTQVVHVYDHNLADFEFNAKKIIDLYRPFYGEPAIGEFTIAQPVCFQVVKGGPKFTLPLFKFFINYVMLITPVEIGADLRDWQPWTPMHWTNESWCRRMDEYVRHVRNKANMRKICECLELSKYLMNLWVDRAGDRLGLSISNHEFIEVMKRSKEARESITCTFDIPEDITPPQLEKLTMERTTSLLKFIGEQTDLSLSVYARNNLFNPTQFREYAVHITHKPTLNGTTVAYTYPTNIIMGLQDPRAAAVDSYGGRKAEITKLNVSEAGVLERSLMMMMSPVRYVDINYECESPHFRKRYVGSPKDLEKLNGRVFTREPGSGRYRIVDPRDVDLVGKTLYLKTPITCTHPRRAEGYICSACYGKIMASLNCDVHIGRIAAAQAADEIEQKLLSAKHALRTDTVPIEFDEIFYKYFELGNGHISMNADMVEASRRKDPEFEHLHLEFYPATMKKHQDGESRHFDRSFEEIVIYDDRDDSRINIGEKNGAPLYLTPEFNDDWFRPAMSYQDATEVIRIPFNEIIDHGKIITATLFEFNYRNNELASPLLTLETIMFNRETISAFDSYDDCLDTLIPLFVKGGIHVPDYQIELLLSQMIIGADGRAVDWNDPHPDYSFQSINKSIHSLPSPLTGLLYRESGRQIAGAYGTYEKWAPDSYSEFLYENR